VAGNVTPSSLILRSLQGKIPETRRCLLKWTMPVHKIYEAHPFADYIIPGTNMQMIGIAQLNLTLKSTKSIEEMPPLIALKFPHS
jgi:hypothetical protein